MLALIISYETIEDNPKKSFKVFSCVVYSIIKNCVCIYYLAYLSKQLSEITVGCGGGSKYGDKNNFNRILGIGIPDLLMNLMSCHEFLKNINYVVVLKCPKRMLG